MCYESTRGQETRGIGCVCRRCMAVCAAGPMPVVPIRARLCCRYLRGIAVEIPNCQLCLCIYLCLHPCSTFACACPSRPPPS